MTPEEQQSQSEWEWAQAQKTKQASTPTPTPPPESPGFFSTDTLKGIGQSAAQGVSELWDAPSKIGQALVTKIDPYFSDVYSQASEMKKELGIPQDMTSALKDSIGEPNAVPGSAQDFLYDGVKLGTQNAIMPGMGSLGEVAAVTGAQTLGGQATQAIGAGKAPGQIVGGLAVPIAETAAAHFVGPNPAAEAEKYAAAANGMSQAGFQKSIKGEASFNPDGSMQTPLLSSFQSVASQGGFDSGNAAVRLTPGQKLANFSNAQDQLAQQADNIATQVDRLGTSTPNYTLSDKAISDSNVFTDPATRQRASDWLDVMKQDISKDTNTTQGMLAKKRAIYTEIAKSYDPITGTYQDPSWLIQMKQNVAADLKNTTQEVANLRFTGSGDQLARINGLWGDYADVAKEFTKPAGAIVDGSSLTKGFWSPVTGALSSIAGDGAVQKAVSWLYGAADTMHLGGMQPDPSGVMAAMRTAAGLITPDPNALPPAMQASRNAATTDPQDKKAQANIAFNASMAGATSIPLQSPEMYSSLPTQLQQQILRESSTAMPQSFIPGVKGYQSSYQVADGSWRVPIGSMDYSMELQQSMENKSPAQRALTAGPLLRNGTITTPSAGLESLESNKKMMPTPQRDPLAFLSGSMSEPNSDPMMMHNMEPQSESDMMLEKMQKAQSNHGF